MCSGIPPLGAWLEGISAQPARSRISLLLQCDASVGEEALIRRFALPVQANRDLGSHPEVLPGSVGLPSIRNTSLSNSRSSRFHPLFLYSRPLRFFFDAVMPVMPVIPPQSASRSHIPPIGCTAMPDTGSLIRFTGWWSTPHM